MIAVGKWRVGFVWSVKMTAMNQISVNNNALEQIESEHNARIEFDCNTHVHGEVFYWKQLKAVA